MYPIRITAVSYLNTKPFLYGLFKSELGNQIDLQLNIPSVCAQKLKNEEADLGLVPVAIIPELNDPKIISDYCIGTVGSVKTVCLYSDVPIHLAERVFLDYHSKTSVELVKILLHHYWKTSPELIPAQKGYIDLIKGTTAGLVIGDRAIGLETQFPYVYDLGAIWQKFSGLPFVFAAWVSTRRLPEDFIKAFNQALHKGLLEIPQLIYLLPSPKANFDLTTYFTKYISYELDASKKEGLSRFLKFLQPSVEISFDISAEEVN